MTDALRRGSQEAADRARKYRNDPAVSEARDVVEQISKRLDVARREYNPVRDEAQSAARMADEVATLAVLGDTDTKAAERARRDADKAKTKAEEAAEGVRILQSALETARERVVQAQEAAKEAATDSIRSRVRDQAAKTIEAMRAAQEATYALFVEAETGRHSGLPMNEVDFRPLLDGAADQWEAEVKRWIQ